MVIIKHCLITIVTTNVLIILTKVAVILVLIIICVKNVEEVIMKLHHRVVEWIDVKRIWQAQN